MEEQRWREVDTRLEQAVLADDPALADALAASRAAGLPDIAVSPLQGKLLHLLARAHGARRVLEVGTLGGYSTTWPETEEVMGWEIVETGLKVRLSKSVPDIVRAKLRDNLTDACESLGLDFDGLKHFVLHPGGAKVLDAFEEVLGLEPGDLTFSRSVLRDFGNMSSVTVLFILERFLESDEWEDGDPGVLSAMGPGFSSEHVLFRCR